MIQEIVNFIDEIPKNVFSYNLKLDEGLYIFVELDNNGKLVNAKYQLYKKDADLDSFFDKCLTLQTKVKPVAPSKIFNPIKKILGGSCSGFALCFNKKNLYKDKVFRIDEIKDSLVEYFKGAEKYVLEENENHVVWFSKFKLFCCNNLIAFLQELPEYTSLKDNSSVNIFLNEPSIEDFQKLYDPYVANSVFNKDDYKTELESVIYNIADSLSSFSEKKMFWRHKTAPFEFNYKITGEQAKKIWQFFNIRGRVLPNPLPIFIDKKELNQKVIEIVNEDKKLGYTEIITKIHSEKKNDLGNYYLLFFQKGELVDLDFVPSFQILIDDMFISEFFSIGGKQEKRITNLFEFEFHVANRILNGQLITKTKAGGWWLKYFGDIDYDPKYLTDNTYNQLLRYRKAFYDYIYKAKREAIQSLMFHDIMLKGILDDLKADEFKDRNHTKDFPIKEKLNIWFSLYYYFDSVNKSPIDMINKTKLLSERIRQIADDSTDAIKNDDEFAFASGQLIRYLLGQSEVGDRSHALLEPFLQKTDATQFRLAIARIFEMYKHAIPFYKGNNRYAFDRIMSQVMGIEPQQTNLKDLLPMILAGYFAESVFKKQVEQ
jgi:CRISPR-associated protein Csh1